MATYVTSRCPHCRARIRTMSPKNAHDYGSPLRSCARCGATYLDTYYVELAINDRDLKSIKRVEPGNLFFVFFCGFMLFGSLQVMYESLGMALFFIGMAGAAFLFSIYLLVSLFVTYDQRIDEMVAKKRLSEERLSNLEYAYCLKRFGYDVPEQYL